MWLMLSLKTAAEMSDITLMPNPGSSPSASNVDGSNPNNIMGWNMLSPVGDFVEIYETDEKVPFLAANLSYNSAQIKPGCSKLYVFLGCLFTGNWRIESHTGDGQQICRSKGILSINK